jgi:hypothetical protein
MNPREMFEKETGKKALHPVLGLPNPDYLLWLEAHVKLGGNMVFKVGDRVEWVSQSQGYTKSKSGEVVEVVPAGHTPATKYSDLYRGAGPGNSRRHESYVVAVRKVTRLPRASVKHYWPIVSKLTLVV